jgi:alpha-L-fucosidase 2
MKLHAVAMVASAVLLLSPMLMAGEATPSKLDSQNVVWTTPSANSAGSMPVGNGDIGLNVWVEPNGDLLFYIGKTDAWGDDVKGDRGLLKVGRVRVKLTPPLSTAEGFRQTLVLREGAIEIQGGTTTLRVWVDANKPVIRVEAAGKDPIAMQAAFETLRPTAAGGLGADTVLDGQKDRVVWFYRNRNKQIERLRNLTFGAIMQGEGLTTVDRTTLRSAKPAATAALSIYPFTAQTETPELWTAQAEKLAASAASGDRAAHNAWWQKFWDRSWIYASGDEDAKRITQGYVLQRFVSACAGRGAYPIKFNGSIFTMDWVKGGNRGGQGGRTMNADTRDWGGQYWFQNTRPMYWPMLQAGDFEMMQPLFRMYQGQLAGNTKAVRQYYEHDGAYFVETNPFWGEVPNIRPNAGPSWTLHYFTPILELSSMMLDYFAYTGDREFVKQTLLPIADAGLTFFDQHFKRENGKLLLDPDNSIEQYWKARNPAPDIGGLHWLTQGLLALPQDLTTAEQRTRWQRLAGELPELPKTQRNGTTVLAFAEKYDNPRNSENPELYAIYPFRLYGLGKPDLDLAKATFAARRFKNNGCWTQDGVQAAYLGDVEAARRNVIAVFKRQESQCRFPAFWEHGNDYVPDEDNGGHGMHALQLMLLQSEGSKITLLPTWPKQWDVEFKLNAPGHTTVEGVVKQGKLVEYKVTPESRKSDVAVPK